jgi:hypothetical protein
LGLGIASLVLGIIAVPFAFLPCISTFSIPVSGLGLILGGSGLIVVLSTKKGSMGFPIAGSTVCLVALAIAGMWFLVCAGLMSGAKKMGDDFKKAGDEFFSRIDEQQRQEAASWVDASKDAAKHGDVRVRVTSVTLGPVDLNGNDRKTEKSLHDNLQIRLVIENTSAEKNVDYKGWSIGAGPDVATLKDNAFATYPAAGFAKQVKGQIRKSEPIKPAQSLEDILVFQAPLNNPQELRLELPATAFGGLGKIKFRIPAAMIKR